MYIYIYIYKRGVELRNPMRVREIIVENIGFKLYEGILDLRFEKIIKTIQIFVFFDSTMVCFCKEEKYGYFMFLLVIIGEISTSLARKFFHYFS